MQTIWFVLAACLVGYASPQEQEVCQIDLAILVDESGSIKDNGGIVNWYSVLNFTRGVIEEVRKNEDSHVAFITFGNVADLKFNLAEDNTANMIAAVEALRDKVPNANTNTSAALYMTLNKVFVGDGAGDRPGVQNVVLLLTDGVPTYGLNKKILNQNGVTQDELNNETLDWATELKDDGTLFLAVGVSDRINEDLLKAMVTREDRDYFMVTNFDGLMEDLDAIIAQTCTVITTPKPPSQCREDSDVYFLLDTSGSISESRFKTMRNFLANDLVPELGIGAETQVGLLYYSTEDHLLFGLDAYTTFNNLSAAIMDVPFMRRETNAAASLRYARENGFTLANGDRPNAKNIIVIFTDGNSNVDSTQTLAEAFKVKMDEIHIISVAIDDWMNEYELQSMASYPYEVNTLYATTDNDFNTTLRDTLKALICNDVNECSPNPCTCEAFCVDEIGHFTCDCGGTCTGETCQQECLNPADVVFAVDASGSMDKHKFRLELNFVGELVMRLNPAQSNIGLIRYATNAEMMFNIGEFNTKEDVMNAITMRYTRGSTNTAAAIDMATNQMFNNSLDGRRKVLVLITDGRSDSKTDAWRAARTARESGVVILVVAIGNNIDADALDGLASGVLTNVFSVPDFSSLSGDVSSVSDRICNNENECEFLDCNNGEKVDHTGYCECECPSTVPMSTGYNCERACSGEIDIVLLVDASGSIRNNRWKAIKEFLAEFENYFQVGEDSTHFGAVYFSDVSSIEFQLNSFMMKEDVMYSTSDMPYLGDMTNIAGALEMTKDQVLSAAMGNRENVPDYVIFISDGESTLRVGEAVSVAVLLREQGATVISVGIGTQANTLELRGITSYPLERNLHFAESFNDIVDNTNMRNALLNSLVAATCNDVNECDDNPCVEGTCDDLSGDYYCNCPVGTSGKNCDRQCTNQLDVALVLDFSDSMDNIVDLIIAFAREVIIGLPSTYQVAVVYYSDDAHVLFYLDQYTDTFSMLNALAFSRSGTRTNTAAALQLLESQVFTPGTGDSSNPNVAVVLTDGGSSVNRADTIPSANAARDSGIELFSVAFGTNTQMEEINGIANDPDSEHVVLLPDAASVTTAANTLLTRLCDL